MPGGLALTLYARLAAMGDLAVGERRGGFDRPGRSAILGLAAAALGLDRADEAGHAALDRGYRPHQVLLPGALVGDYHTVQVPPTERKARWASRCEALDRPSHRLATLLSSRDYRADVWVDVALVRVAEAGPPPEALAEALRRPAYTLFFGRKSYPLGRPVHPHCVSDVATVAGLLDRLDTPEQRKDGLFAPLRLDRVWDRERGPLERAALRRPRPAAPIGAGLRGASPRSRRAPASDRRDRGRSRAGDTDR